jgi:hypothetical protein
LFSLDLVRVTLIILLSVALTSCTATPVATRSHCDKALDQVSMVIQVYTKQHFLRLYPRTLKELRHFAASRGTPLDLTAFSEFTYKASARDWDILYTCKDTGLGGAMGGTTVPAFH